MSASLKLVCLNIEKNRHFERVIPFLLEQMPDVFCVQEIYESSVTTIAKVLMATEYVYVPMTGRPTESPPEIQGIAIFSRLPIRGSKTHYYVGTPESVPESNDHDPLTWNANNRMVIVCEIEKEEEIFRICTTHFTWSERGTRTDKQMHDMDELLKVLGSLGEFVLCGDFNVSRGRTLFGMLARRYKDNVPLHYKTSLDLELHRAAKLRRHEIENKMVDGIFSTPEYEVSNVEMISGVSDHRALVATVSRT
ncbi:MAG: endonuclease/exonuclease/phosphatase family protein [bacterium]|nr:endonuclease/exonuclease/phosphatase family protein [bacterium]